MTHKTSPHPFIKWAGGKTLVSNHVLHRLPDQMDVYFEPMVGGGAIFFKLAAASRFRNAVIADTNQDLINAWRVIQSSVDDLIKELKSKKYKYDKKVYLKIRELDPDKLDPIKKAARFIYLNRTCFNGLYRVNKNGKFNVPFGDYTNPVICDSKNLKAVSKLLVNVKILEKDFEEVCNMAKKGDGIYLDPPYLPLSKTSNFTSYTKTRFNLEQHQRLAKIFKKLVRKRIRTVLTNSFSPMTLELYKGHDMDLISGLRNIGGPASYRNSVKEAVIFGGAKLQ